MSKVGPELIPKIMATDFHSNFAISDSSLMNRAFSNKEMSPKLGLIKPALTDHHRPKPLMPKLYKNPRQHDFLECCTL